MPFRKKGSPFWHYDFQINGSRYAGSTKTKDVRKAKKIEAHARMKAEAGQSDKTAFNVATALGTYFIEVSQFQSSAATTRSQTKAILEHLDGDKLLSQLSQGDLNNLQARMRANCANATANRRIQLLGRAVRHMVKNHNAAVTKLDFKSVETKEPAEVIRELSSHEQDRLFAAVRPDLLPFIQFALMTGARRETVERLEWKHVDFDTMTLWFTVKGERPQPFPISNGMRAFLTALPRSNVLAHRSYVFTLLNQQTGDRQRVFRSTFDAAWRKARKAASIEDFRVHDLRHTFATRTLRRTGNLKLVSKLLGHKSIETTMKYAHVLDEDLQDALDAFDPLSAQESRKKSHNLKISK